MTTLILISAMVVAALWIATRPRGDALYCPVCGRRPGVNMDCARCNPASRPPAGMRLIAVHSNPINDHEELAQYIYARRDWLSSEISDTVVRLAIRPRQANNPM